VSAIVGPRVQIGVLICFSFIKYLLSINKYHSISNHRLFRDGSKIAISAIILIYRKYIYYAAKIFYNDSE
jgi:hypothetical protein